MPWFAECGKEVWGVVWKPEGEQRAAKPPLSPHLSAEDPLCVLSGAHPSEHDEEITLWKSFF